MEFDLSDPYCHVISNEYQPLHDPHLKNHYNLPRMRRHLRKKGFITERDKVICNLREFNQYRQYLHKMCLLEMAKERKVWQISKIINLVGFYYIVHCYIFIL